MCTRNMLMERRFGFIASATYRALSNRHVSAVEVLYTARRAWTVESAPTPPCLLAYSQFSALLSTSFNTNPTLDHSMTPKRCQYVTCPAQSYTRTDVPPSVMDSTSAKTVLSLPPFTVGAGFFSFMLRHRLREHAGNHSRFE